MILVYRLGWFLGLVLCQVLIFNHIHISEYATPVLYVYFLFSLNAAIGRKALLLWAFFLGLAVDVFSNTPGVNACACTLFAFFRPFILRTQTVRDMIDDFSPGISTMGFSHYLRYVLIGTFILVGMIQLIETFSFLRWESLCLKILIGTLVSVVGILCIDSMRRKK